MVPPRRKKRGVSEQQAPTMKRENQLTTTFGPIEVKEVFKHVSLAGKKEVKNLNVAEEPQMTRFAETQFICDKVGIFSTSKACSRLSWSKVNFMRIYHSQC